MNRLIRLKTTAPPLLITLALLCFGLLPRMEAVVPPPDGGYPNFTTAEGTKALQSLTTGSANTAVGWLSLFSTATGSFNTATGAGSLLFNTADQNTAFGAAALLFNTTGINNTAVGAAALLHNTSGEENTATGAFALSSNTEGDFNTANGYFALSPNTTGERNTAIGDSAMFSNTTGSRNTATGNAALGFNTTGVDNTAIGAAALFFNDADGNTAIGADTLSDNTTGSGNTAAGVNALANNTAGNSNTAYGGAALTSNTIGADNTAVGAGALDFNTSGLHNIAIGSGAGNSVTTASNVICMGHPGENVDNSCFIGQIYSNVQPIVGTDPDSVTITSAGRLGRGNVSSRRYKHDIKPMEKASEALYALKPASFRYNKEYDATQTLAFGLIAEEVAEVAPDLVGRNPDGQPESVRYDQVNAMLLNEFLKEHRKVQEQEATITQLRNDFRATVAQLARRLDGQAAQIQKVSAQLAGASPSRSGLEVSESAPQIAVNDP